MLPFRTLNIELIKAFREGSEPAFNKIYESFASNVYAFAYSFLKDKVQSEEIVQETFLALWENREKFDGSKAFEPYIFTISKRLILDDFRKATRNATLREKLMLKISEVDNNTEYAIIFEDLMAFAEKAINELPQQQQLVFRLSRFEGLSFDEIGERLNLSKNTVKNHLVVALKKLKSKIGGEEMIYMLLFLLGN